MGSVINYIFPLNYFVDLTIYQYGQHKCDALHAYGPSMRNHFLFHYIVSGKGLLRSCNEKGIESTYKLKAGDGFLICPKQETFYEADKNDPWHYYWVEFNGLKAKEISVKAGLGFDQPIYSPKQDCNQSKVKDSISNIILGNKSLSAYELMGNLYIFLGALAETNIYREKAAQEAGGLKEFYVNEILNYIEAYFHKNISVEDISDRINLNRSHANRIFKSVMGLSLKEFLIQYKINKACEMLQNSHHNISQISEMVGYSNMFNFSRTFKSIKGESPRAWRVKNKLR